MERIKISSNGPEFSRIVAGVWKWGKWGHNLTPKEILDLVKSAIDAGVTTFDHADIYGDYTDEKLFGDALALEPSLRSRIEIVSKCAIKLISSNRPDHRLKSYDTSESHIRTSVENSLKELNTDYLDLLLIHRPDPLLDPDEISKIVHDLKNEGKILHFGVSNFTPSQFEMLSNRLELTTNQIEISLLHNEPLFDGSLDQCLRKRVTPMAWSPLGSGKLFQPTEDAHIQRVKDALNELAAKYEVETDQILLAWLLKHPANVLPVLGTARMDRLIKAVDTLRLDFEKEDWFWLLEKARGREVD